MSMDDADVKAERLNAESQELIAAAEAELAGAIEGPKGKVIAQKIKKLIFVIVTLMTAGCVGAAPAPVSNACAWEKIIHPSRSDTIETLRQVDEHNQDVRANCPGAG